MLRSLGGKAVELSAQLLLITTVPRLLGPSDYGVFALALAIVTLGSSALSIGGPTLMSRFVPAVDPGQRDAMARAFVVRLGRWRALELAVITIVATTLAVALPETFPTAVTALVGLALALDLVATLAFQSALGLGISSAWSFRFAVQNLLVVLGALVGHATAGIGGAVAGIAVASASSLVWGVVLVGPRLRRARSGVAIPPGALRFGVLQALSNAATHVLQRGTIVAVAIFAGSRAQTGFCALAVGVALAATYAIWQMFTVQLPGLVEQVRGTTTADAEAEVRRLARPTVVVAMLAALLGVAVLGQAVPIVFGDRYEGAVGAVAVALAVLPLAPLTGIATQAAALRLRADLRLWSAGIGVLVMLGMSAVLIPDWQAQGGTAALLAGTVAAVLVSLVAMPRAFDRFVTVVGLGGSALVIAVAALTGSL